MLKSILKFLVFVLSLLGSLFLIFRDHLQKLLKAQRENDKSTINIDETELRDTQKRIEEGKKKLKNLDDKLIEVEEKIKATELDVTKKVEDINNAKSIKKTVKSIVDNWKD